MTKWIVMLVCALTLTACGSMSNRASSGSGDSSSSGSSSGQSYASGSPNDLTLLPGAWGAGTFGDSGP